MSKNTKNRKIEPDQMSIVVNCSSNCNIFERIVGVIMRFKLLTKV